MKNLTHPQALFEMVNSMSGYSKPCRLRISLVLLALLFLPWRASSAQEVIRLTMGEYPPYLSSRLEGNGVAARLVTAAFAAEGIEMELAVFPWKRAYLTAKNNEWDGSLVYFWSQEREQDFYYSAPLYHEKYVFLHQPDFVFDWDALADLRGIKLGATRGYTYTPEFYRLVHAGVLEVEWVTDDLTNLRKLALGRIQLFPGSEEVVRYLIKDQMGSELEQQFIIHPRPFFYRPLYLLLSRGDPRNLERMRVFNRGLKKVREQFAGELDELPLGTQSIK
jgi:polar amino acid transport system substrate-binding protein